MDFIERYFTISPDGGSGVTEAHYVVAAALVVLFAVCRRSIVRTMIRLISRVGSKRP
jgi:hypothetical protein